MKIIEAIRKTDELKPNSYPQKDKLRWLSIVDGQIKKDIIDTHHGGRHVIFTPYTEATDIDNTDLLVPFPYDDLYVSWLSAQIDYNNGEIEKYNNSIADYNEQITAYSNWYNRTHMPLNTNIKYF